MSYILDALRKAERERHLGQPPNLAIPSAPDRPERQRHWFWLGVGLVLGLNAVLLAAFLIRPQPATTGKRGAARAAPDIHGRGQKSRPPENLRG